MALAGMGVMFWVVAMILGMKLYSSVQGRETAHRDGPTKIDFYMHNPGLFTSFPSSTVLSMKGRRRSFKSNIIAFDNMITLANDQGSPVLGRAQGIRVADEVGEGPLAFTWLFTASFNSSIYSGSLSFQGTTLNFPSSEFSDATVSGGTGDFRFARGYATFTNFYKSGEIWTLEGQHFQVFLRY